MKLTSGKPHQAQGAKFLLFIILITTGLQSYMYTRDITQAEYSRYIVEGLLEFFPQFENACVWNENDVVTIEFPSENKTISIWITTYDLETTIGFDNNEGDCCWHVHICSFAANELINELMKAKELLRRILGGECFILCNDSTKIYIVPDCDEDLSNVETLNEGFVLRKWSEL